MEKHRKTMREAVREVKIHRGYLAPDEETETQRKRGRTIKSEAGVG